MKRLLMAVVIAGLGLAFTGSAGAFTQSATGTMTIGATKVAACSVSTLPLDFGNYDGTVITANSSITVNCNASVGYRVDIDAGQNYDPTIGRRIKTGTAAATTSNSLLYTLYQDSAYSTEWGDNGTTYCVGCTPVVQGKGGVGSGANQVLTVYGMLNTGMYVTPLGSYTDTVTVTVNY